jgi:hypothetical protein
MADAAAVVAGVAAGGLSARETVARDATTTRTTMPTSASARWGADV